MGDSTMFHVVVRKDHGVVSVEKDASKATFIASMSKEKGKTVTRSCFPSQVDEMVVMAEEMKSDDSFFCPWEVCEGEECVCNN